MVLCKNKKNKTKQNRKRRGNIVLSEESGLPGLSQTQGPLGQGFVRNRLPRERVCVVDRDARQLQGAPGEVGAVWRGRGRGAVVVEGLRFLPVLLHPRVEQLLLALFLPHKQLHHEDLLLVHLLADVLGDVRDDPVHKVAHEHDQVLEGESAPGGGKEDLGSTPTSTCIPPGSALSRHSPALGPQTHLDFPGLGFPEGINETGNQPGVGLRWLPFLKESELSK